MSSNNSGSEDERTTNQPSTNLPEDRPVQDGLTPRDGTDRVEPAGSTAADSTTADVSLSRNDWEKLEPNPDPRTDLGYRVDDWERFDTSDNSDQVIYLPSEESLIKEDAFIVAEEAILCDLGEYY